MTIASRERPSSFLEGDHALDLVRLDHRGEHVAHDDRSAVAGQPVCDRENSAEVVRGVAPLRGEPGIVEIEPADGRADAEGRLHRVQLEARAGDARALGDRRSRNERPEKLGARGIIEGLQAASERVHQAQPRGVVGFRAFYFIFADIVGDVDEDLVRFGPDIGNGRGHQYSFLMGPSSFGTSVGCTPGSPEGGLPCGSDGTFCGASGRPCAPDGGSRRQR